MEYKIECRPIITMGELAGAKNLCQVYTRSERLNTVLDFDFDKDCHFHEYVYNVNGYDIDKQHENTNFNEFKVLMIKKEAFIKYLLEECEAEKEEVYKILKKIFRIDDFEKLFKYPPTDLRSFLFEISETAWAYFTFPLVFSEDNYD